jgi:hypothetical protein
MRNFLRILAALMICSSAIAAEPKLIGRGELLSLMNLTEQLGNLAEKVSPGSSAMLVLGATALAFNPEYRDFEVTAPIDFYLYSVPEGSKNGIEWIIAPKKKGGGMPATVKVAGQQSYVKEFGDVAAISSSKALLDSLSKLPEKTEKKDQKIIEISLYPSIAMKECREKIFELRRKIVKSNVNKDKNGKVDLAELKSLQIKLDFLEKALAQIAELKIGISLNKEASLISLNIVPEKGSALETFILAQNKVKGKLPPFYANKNATGSTNLELTADFRKSAASFVEEMAIEQCEDESKLKYLDLVSAIAQNVEGKSSYYANLQNGIPCARLDLFANKEAMEKIKKSAAGIDNIETNVKDIYKLSEYKIPEFGKGTVYCFLTEKGASIASGKFTPEEAKAMIMQKEEREKPTAKHENCAMVFKEKEPTEITLMFDKGTAQLNAVIGAELLKGYLPGAQNQELAPQRKNNNAGPPRSPKERKRLKINPKDFVR